MKLVYQKRDISTLDRQKCVVAQAISSDTAMGAGIAVVFNKIHPKLKSSCRDFSESHNRDVIGKSYRYEDKQGVVYNLFTKKSVYDKAGVGMTVQEYHENLKKCFTDLREQMIKNNEIHLGIPQIGCGLDKCMWEDVSNIIIEVFKDTNIFILVCLWGSNIQYPKNQKVW